MPTRRGPVFVLGLVTACGAGGRPANLLTEGQQPPPDVAEACDLAARRCSRCHPLERLLLAHVTSPASWQWYVDRMRHQPESGITEPEGRTIVRCLVFRNFGQRGLESLEVGTR